MFTLGAPFQNTSHWPRLELVQIIESVEDKKMFSTLNFMKSKLKNKLQEYLPMIMGMYTQTFFELDNFPYNATYDCLCVTKNCENDS